MKVRNKIALLLTVCAAVLVGLILLYSVSEERRLVSLLGQESKERAEGIRKTIDVAGRSLETLVFEYTHWDEMVDFVMTGDKAWARENIDASLDTYKASGVWIYNQAGTLSYSVDALNGQSPMKLAFNASEIKKLFDRSKFIHFFIATAYGPMEIRGATVHPSQDTERKTPIGGYFLAGKLWDRSYIDNLANMTASKIKIFPPDDKKNGFVSDPGSGVIVVNRMLEDWQNRPVARISISGYSDIAKVFTRDSRIALVMILGFGIILVAVMYILLMKLISAPLGLISMALEREDAKRIKSLTGRKDEFGRLAGLIDKFFEQKESLLAEVKGHGKSDEKLATKMKELEDAYRQLKDMQSRLVQSEKLAALGRFASGVAHEVKNPLSILLGGLEYIKAKLPSADPELREAMVKMREAVMRADIVVKDLLTFARPSKATSEIIHPNSLVHDAVVFIELFKHKSDTADINIVQDLTDKEISVEVDAGQMQQALFNILLNAIEAMPMQGDIFIKTADSVAVIPPESHDKKVCVIEIKDTGCGIAKEDMHRVFEPFFTTKRDRKGTGLGLSIVRSIIDKNKGSVIIHSEVDKGTTVKIVLPVTDKSTRGGRR